VANDSRRIAVMIRVYHRAIKLDPYWTLIRESQVGGIGKLHPTYRGNSIGEDSSSPACTKAGAKFREMSYL